MYMTRNYKRAAAVFCSLAIATVSACGNVNNDTDNTITTDKIVETRITETPAENSATTKKMTTSTTTTTASRSTTTVQTEPPVDDGIIPYTKIEPSRTNGTYASAVTKYTADLYRQTALCNASAGKGALSGRNDLVSGYSAMLAFGMTANGAAGNTKTQLLAALGDIALDTLNNETSALMKEYGSENAGSEERSVLNIANSIWINENQAGDVKQGFLDECGDSFMSETRREVFDSTALSNINDWVSTKTHGMIPSILNDIDPSQKMILINCLCFEDTWQEQFEEEQIDEGIFNSADGTKQGVTMLNSMSHGYFSNEYFEGFTQSYSNWRFYFAAMLPREGVSIEQAVNGLNEKSIEDFLFRPNYDVLVKYKIPEFSYDYDTSLVDEMKNLGCKEAFDRVDGGDFSEMIDISDRSGRMYISDALQKTHIEFDRYGTKAAAVTAVPMSGGGPGATIIKELDFDRPFIYMIV